jgi:hypothetical protein
LFVDLTNSVEEIQAYCMVKRSAGIYCGEEFRTVLWGGV